jgi:hypothetical protein
VSLSSQLRAAPKLDLGDREGTDNTLHEKLESFVLLVSVFIH